METLFARQDGLVTRRQALVHLSEDEIATQLGRRWQVVLPGVYAGFTGGLTDHQRARAALLLVGPESMLTDLTALRVHGVSYLPDESLVRVLVREPNQRSSREFVVVRRTTRFPPSTTLKGLPLAPVYRALAEFVGRHGDERASLAVAASAVQAGRASLMQIRQEACAGPARGRPRLMRVLAALEAGIRSAPEDDFRQIVRGSRLLPQPVWNARLVLPSGREVSPDALFLSSGVVHETNGRDVHAGFDDFEHMQRRHDDMTSAGLVVLHNSPRRLRSQSAAVLEEVERCHRQHDGRGLPDGVRLLASPSHQAM